MDVFDFLKMFINKDTNINASREDIFSIIQPIVHHNTGPTALQNVQNNWLIYSMSYELTGIQ